MGFADARAAADRAENVQRTQAARTVLGNAIDATDCRELLNMLGLPDPERNAAAAARRVSEHRYEDAPGASPQAGARE